MNRKIFISLLFLFLVACSAQTKEVPFEEDIGKKTPLEKTVNSDASQLNPEQVVRQYYNSLNEKDYEMMYSLISDGFKKIEHTASTLDAFGVYMSGFFDTSSGIQVVSVKEISNDGKEAVVEYAAEITLVNGKAKELESKFTLKKRDGGWRLIHPYGDNIDTS